jgi:hypothetical protein
MDEVIESCQVAFEEDGINSQTLEDLRKVTFFLLLFHVSSFRALRKMVQISNMFFGTLDTVVRLSMIKLILFLLRGLTSCTLLSISPPSSFWAWRGSGAFSQTAGG